MAVPVVVVAGFLGAGKTTLINHLLSHAGGRRIAAVVNDFGAINIDAALIAGAADGVVGLQNGCICCTLQGDLLRTIGMLLRRTPPPDGIVVETSGVADPAPIVAALLDPAIWREAPLDAVIGVVDAADALEHPARREQPLYRAQLAAADFAVLNKLDLVPQAEVPALLAGLRAAGLRGRVVPAQWGAFPVELLFSAGLHVAAEGGRRTSPAASPYDTLSWVGAGPVDFAAFQAVMEGLAPSLVRAKGLLQFVGQPGRTALFQMVGQRATLAAGPPADSGAPPAQLVLIHELGQLDPARVRRALDGCVAPLPAQVMPRAERR